MTEVWTWLSGLNMALVLAGIGLAILLVIWKDNKED